MGQLKCVMLTALPRNARLSSGGRNEEIPRYNIDTLHQDLEDLTAREMNDVSGAVIG